MKIIDKRNTQISLTDIPYGKVFIDRFDVPKMKVLIGKCDYIVNLKNGDAYRVLADTIVTPVEAVLTIN